MKISELKILELASVLAGPQVGSFFAELGASVAKIENKTTGGDVTRQWRLPTESSNTSVSAYYASANTNKAVLQLNLKDTKDYDLVCKLVAESDIVITNFKYGSAKKLKLDYNTLKTINPTLIYGEITGFGPKVSRSAFDVILQAETGYISMTGTDAQHTAKLPVAFIDLFAAHQLKEGILVALVQKQFPAKVSVSLYDSAIASLANQASNYLMEKYIPKPIGTKHPNIAPYGDVFVSKDNKPFLFAIGNDKQFECLLNLLELENNKMFESNATRVKHRNELIEILSPKLAQFNRDELLNKCEKLEIPAGAVYDLKEVFENPLSQKMVLEETQEDQETKKVKSVVFTISS